MQNYHPTYSPQSRRAALQRRVAICFWLWVAMCSALFGCPGCMWLADHIPAPRSSIRGDDAPMGPVIEPASKPYVVNRITSTPQCVNGPVVREAAK